MWPPRGRTRTGCRLARSSYCGLAASCRASFPALKGDWDRADRAGSRGRRPLHPLFPWRWLYRDVAQYPSLRDVAPRDLERCAFVRPRLPPRAGTSVSRRGRGRWRGVSCPDRSGGISASRIVIAGDSAGGGLALALLLALSDSGDRLPAAAVLFSPWTDLAATGNSIVDNDAADPLFFGSWVAGHARHYLGATPATNPLASPVHARFDRAAAAADPGERLRSVAGRFPPHRRERDARQAST